MLRQAEAAIVAHLQATPGLPDQVRIVPWPDRPQDFTRPQNQGTIFVRFAGLDLEPNAGASRRGGVQTGSIRFELRLLLKDLRSHEGAYDQLELCQRRLHGFRIPPQNGYTFHVAGLQLLRADLVERLEGSGQWDWGVMFASDLIYENQGDL